ncbi:MAG: LysR family transcriptional regulator [Bacteriovoracaceae bacterium]|nr:LysR family transcriptional regulator [Bacteriovoracaceae bacterium]
MPGFNLDYRYLKAFQVTAEYLNFSKAAKELKIAQSAVSRQIKLLENSLGQQLIIRSSKKVILTTKGEELHHALNFFENKAKSFLMNAAEKPLRIGILHGLLENWFIHIIRDLSMNYNNLQIETAYPADLKRELIEGSYELIISTENVQSELVTSLKILDENLVLIGPENIELKQLENYPWIVYNEDDWLLKLQKNTSSKIIQVNSMTAITKLVEEKVGIAVVPEHIVQKNHTYKKYALKTLTDPCIYLSTLNYQTMPEHIDKMIKTIKKYC